MTELENKFLSLLQSAIQNRCSDIHLTAGLAPALRTAQGLIVVNTPPFTMEEMLKLGQFMVKDPTLKGKISEIQDLDGSFEVNGLGRFRFNIFRNSAGMSAVLRVINAKVPRIEDLNVSPVLKKIADAERGLVLVTGATGSGKSTTLAAMIDYINTNQSLHILTVEDPIEYIHPQRKSRITQREVGKDTTSFANALRSALRQDPDIILVGEMRDFETLDIALKAAETGHLVFSTAHTSDTMKTIGRLLSLFPPNEQAAARTRLADNIQAIVSQRMVLGKSGGKVIAQEILINSFAIRECIANDKKTVEIPGYLEKGYDVGGTQTFDQHLSHLVRNGTISMEVGLESCTNPVDFQRNFSFGDSAIEDNAASQAEALHLEGEQAGEAEAPPPPPAIAKPAMSQTRSISAPPPPMPLAKPGQPPTQRPATPQTNATAKTMTSIKIPKPPGAA